MRTPRDQPVTADFNKALQERAAKIVQDATEALAQAMNKAEGLRKQAECDHEWLDHWDYYHDGHRGDSEQIWYCTKKCGARIPQ